jgi:predicted ester cyclase
MTNKELAKVWFTAIDKNDYNAIKGLMLPDHKFHNPMTPAPVGVDEHLGLMQHMTSSFDGEHHLDQILQDGNYVVVRGRWSGKHIGEFNGVPATGKHVEFSWIDIFEFIDGKVANEYFEMNPVSIMAQIGSMENQKA